MPLAALPRRQGVEACALVGAREVRLERRRLLGQQVGGEREAVGNAPLQQTAARRQRQVETVAVAVAVKCAVP